MQTKEEQPKEEYTRTITLREISQEYLRAFEIKKKKHAKKAKKMSLNDLPSLSEREQKEVLLNKIFPQCLGLSEELKREKSPLMTKVAWRDMNLLCGHSATPSVSLLNKVKRTITYAGDCALATKIVRPHTQASAIAQKQEEQRVLMAHPHVKQAIKKELKKVKKEESVRISFWKKDGIVNNHHFNKEIKGFLYKVLKPMNFSSLGLQIRKLFTDLFIHRSLGVYFLLALLFGSITLKVYLLSGALDQMTYFFPMYVYILTVPVPCSFLAFFWNIWLYPLVVPFLAIFIPYIGLSLSFASSLLRLQENAIYYNEETGVFSFLNYLKCLYQEDRSAFWTLFSAYFLLSVAGIFMLYKAYQNYNRRKDSLLSLAKCLAGFQDLLHSAEKISHLIASSVDLERLHGRKLSYTRWLLSSPERDEDVEKYIDALKKTKFRNRSYFFDSVGPLLLVYQFMKEHKDIMAELIYEIGVLDAELSHVLLLEELAMAKDKNGFTHGRAQDSEGTKQVPQLNIQGMWNPFLLPEEAITNDLVMGVDGRLVVITGPNAGGKSTYILGIGVSIVLHQAFGYAPVQSLDQTVFFKLITYVNPTQNLVRGLSLAEAGMEVLRKHKDILEGCDKPVLAIVDELLNGTDPQVAKKLSYKLLEARHARYPQCLTLLTTHYMNLVALATHHKGIINKKVAVKKVTDGEGRRYDYLYKIEDGISEQNIVKELLEEEGIL